MKPYCLKDRFDKPSVLLPDEARGRLKREVESIKAAYRSPLLRSQALDLVIDRVREEFPQAFKSEK